MAITVRIKKEERSKPKGERKRILEFPKGEMGHTLTPAPIPPPPPKPPLDPKKKYYKYFEKTDGGEATGCHMVIYSTKEKPLKDKSDLGTLDQGDYLIRCENPGNKCAANQACDLVATDEDATGDEIISCDCVTSTKPKPAAPAPPPAPKKSDEPAPKAPPDK
jgi:hypothetical protein